MNRELLKYSDNKSTGIKWLGAVPKHWEVARLKYFLSESLKYGANESADQEDRDCPRFIRITDIKDDGSLREETFKSLDHEIAKPYILNDGDVLLARSGATVGKTFQYRKEWGIAAYAGYLIRARFENQKIANWFYYFSKSKSYWDWLNSIFIQATIQNVSAEKYANLFFSVPPEDEIDQILRFLDHQTTQIDQLIEKKKRLLELLDEQRQAIITNAVTKGVNPDAPMKDSGVDWLGDVPEHWEFKPLKYLVDIDSEKLRDSEDPDLELEYIDIGSVDSEGNIGDKELMRFENAPSRARRIVKTGDTILATVRTYLKAIAHIDYKFDRLQVCSTGFAVLRPRQILPRFLFYWVRSDFFIGEVVSRSVGVSYPAISSTEIGNLPAPLLTLDEQESIANHIDVEIQRIDSIKSKIQTAINRLEEYRSSLITQAVTGKIDIRDTVQEVEMSYAAEEGELYKTNE